MSIEWKTQQEVVSLRARTESGAERDLLLLTAVPLKFHFLFKTDAHYTGSFEFSLKEKKIPWQCWGTPELGSSSCVCNKNTWASRARWRTPTRLSHLHKQEHCATVGFTGRRGNCLQHPRQRVLSTPHKHTEASGLWRSHSKTTKIRHRENAGKVTSTSQRTFTQPM